MATKTVALDPEAYALLRQHRRAGETFSDAVRRLGGRRRSLLDFAGIWKDLPEEEFDRIRAFMAEGRRRDRDRFSRLFPRTE
jgi:predicted CopG family antitoxin